MPAQATFHLIKISEVDPGTDAELQQDAFVELQMYAAGQNAIAGKEVRLYGPTGSELNATTSFSSDVANGENQRTILIGDTAVASPDFVNGELSDLEPSGGAACYVSPGMLTDEFLDCVAWGSFSGTPGSPTGTPVASPVGIPDGQSITRSIAPNCPTALDAGDDTDNSAADFSLTSPSPRNNSSPITETLCAAGGGGSGTDNTAPNTKIKKRPKNRSSDDTPTYKFKSTEAGSKFKCKVDHRRYKKCRSPKTLHGLDPGRHTFKVKATDKAGNTDKTPARDSFKIVASSS